MSDTNKPLSVGQSLSKAITDVLTLPSRATGTVNKLFDLTDKVIDKTNEGVDALFEPLPDAEPPQPAAEPQSEGEATQ